MTHSDIEISGTDVSFARRTLLKGAAAGTVLSAMPWSLRQAFAEEAFDLVVIGGAPQAFQRLFSLLTAALVLSSSKKRPS